MTGVCCVCGNKAEGLIVFGEFVCYTCHEEATGENVKPRTYESKVCGLVKRHRLRDELIADRMNNLRREAAE